MTTKEQQLTDEIEKSFLKIRGWKDWEQYDEIGKSSKLDINIREELINICIQETRKSTLIEVEKMIENRIKRYEHCRNTCESQELDEAEAIKQQLSQLGDK